MNATAPLAALVRSFRLGVSLVSALCLGAASLGGCVVEEVDAFELDDSSVSADEDFRNLQQYAAALVADADFYNLLDNLAEMTAQFAASQNQLTDEQLQAHIVTVEHEGYTQLVDLSEFLAASGVEESLVDGQMELVGELINKHGLGELSATQLEQVFGAAMQMEETRGYLEGAIENELRVIEGEIDTEVDDCEAQCILEYGVAAGIALTAYVSALAAATLLGPGALFAVAAATAAYASALAQAENAKDDCFAECAGEDPSDAECLKDSDCAPDEFCWKGVIGIGANECRPEKSQGEACSRHGQCASGCCKLHVWTNPLSKTCRPANKC